MLKKLSITLVFLAVVSSLDVTPPYSFERPTWFIRDLQFTRNVNSTGGVNATFSIHRSYYDKCPGFPFKGSELIPCGWKIADSPLSCYPSDYQSPGKPQVRNPPQERWYTCHERWKAVDGERLLSEDEKQWIKWRTFGLDEVDMTQLSNGELHGSTGPFRNVSFEFVNGVRAYVNGSLLPVDQIRVTKSIWNVPKSWTECSYPNRIRDQFDIPPPNDQWLCTLSGPGPAEYSLSPAEFNLSGRYCVSFLGYKYLCGLLVNTSESFMSLMEFKRTYP